MKEYQAVDYVKKKRIHSGKRAQLWLVQEKRTGQECLLRELDGESPLYARLAQLDLAGLPQLYCVDMQAGKTRVVEEYLSGQTMADYLEHSGLMTEAQVRDLALVLCDILMQLHANHIIHRDIKPENIFLTNAGEYKLIDFDAARVWKEKQDSDTVCIGTRHYAAPEQYGSQQTDARSDIYSLGVTLRQLLGSGDARPVFLEILAKCTEFDAARRFQSIRELKKALDGTAEPIGKWTFYYHVYRLRWVIFGIGLLLQLVMLARGDQWKTRIPLFLSLPLIIAFLVHRFRKQQKDFRELKQVIPFIDQSAAIKAWKVLYWWLEYVVLWFFGMACFLGGVRITEDPTVVMLISIVLPPVLSVFTVKWRILREYMKRQ